MEAVETFADRAKRLLRQSGLTYQQAGERMGYTTAEARQAVYRFINGKNPSAAMVVKFAKAIEMEIEEVLDDDADHSTKEHDCRRPVRNGI